MAGTIFVDEFIPGLNGAQVFYGIRNILDRAKIFVLLKL